jgi:hypothetical protein
VPLAVLFERKTPGLPAGLAGTARQSRLGTELAHNRRINRRRVIVSRFRALKEEKGG